MKREKPRSRAWEWRESRTTKRQDELRAGGQILATLRWEGWLSTLAHAASPEGQWTFERPGFLSRDVEVRQAGSGALVAVFRAGWMNDGTLELVDGRTFSWGCTDFWQTRWLFFDATEEPMIRFLDCSGLLETIARVEYWPAALSASDRALLSLLGRYLMVLKRQDTAAIAAVMG